MVMKKINPAVKWLGREYYYYEETDSTNVRAKQMAKEGAPHGTVVAAGKQTAGRGRRGREWHSPSGENLYFSVVTRPDIPVEKAPLITLVTACAVAGVLSEILEPSFEHPAETEYQDETQNGRSAGNLSEHGVQIKWPNDIVADGKKLCGILTEMSVEQGKIGYIVTGIGINVNMKEMPEELRCKASSLWMLSRSKEPIDTGMLLGKLCGSLEDAYEKFFAAESLEPFWEMYNKCLVNCGKQVRVLDPAGEYEGISRGIDREGNLIVEKEDGERVTVFSGEVSVRGLYGYV